MDCSSALRIECIPRFSLTNGSYMHRDEITHIAMTRTDFFITGSKDGYVKFWKKNLQGIEFVKVFKAHLGPITALEVSSDGMLLCTMSAQDRALKIFDVAQFDMIHQIELAFVPSCCAWIHAPAAPKGILAVAHRDDASRGSSSSASSSDSGGSEGGSGSISLFKAVGAQTAFHTIEGMHTAAVTLIKYNPKLDIVVSADAKGGVEYWDPQSYELPTAKHGVAFEYKSETSLFEFAKAKTVPTSLEFSPDGALFVTAARDAKIRVFRTATARLVKVYDDSAAEFDRAQKQQSGDDGAPPSVYKLDAIDFGRRAALEREIQKAVAAEVAPAPNVIFDESSNFLIWATMCGVKMVNIHTNKLSRLLGKSENTQRFLRVALFQVPNRVHADTDESLGFWHTDSGCSCLRQFFSLFLALYPGFVFLFSKRSSLIFFFLLCLTPPALAPAGHAQGRRLVHHAAAGRRRGQRRRQLDGQEGGGPDAVLHGLPQGALLHVHRARAGRGGRRLLVRPRRVQ